MGLLATKDPRYWLAKIIAEPAKSTYSMDDIKSIVREVTKANQSAVAFLSDATSESGSVGRLIGDAFTELFGGTGDFSKLSNLIDPFVSRTSAFYNKYTKVMKSGVGYAPDLKADAIEMLTYAAATIDGVRNIVGSGGGNAFTRWVDDVSSVGSAIYKALAGVVKAVLADANKLLTYGVIVVAGVWAFTTFSRPRYRRW